MVCRGVPAPVTNVVAVTVAVHDAGAVPRRSVTVTVPSCAVVVVPGGTFGRAAADGTLMARVPAAMVIEVAWVAVWLAGSVTLTVKVVVAAGAGVAPQVPGGRVRVTEGGRAVLAGRPAAGAPPPQPVA